MCRMIDGMYVSPPLAIANGNRVVCPGAGYVRTYIHKYMMYVRGRHWFFFFSVCVRVDIYPS